MSHLCIFVTRSQEALSLISELGSRMDLIKKLVGLVCLTEPKYDT